jgi:hypothetical protein
MSRPRPLISTRNGPPSGNRSMFSIDRRSVILLPGPVNPFSSIIPFFSPSRKDREAPGRAAAAPGRSRWTSSRSPSVQSLFRTKARLTSSRNSRSADDKPKGNPMRNVTAIALAIGLVVRARRRMRGDFIVARASRGRILAYSLAL